MVTSAQNLTRFGPWPAGLNARDQTYGSELMSNTELRYCKNWEPSDIGLLTPRPGCRRIGSAAMYTDAGTSFPSSGFIALGHDQVVQNQGTWAVVLAYKGTGAAVSNIYYNKWPDNAGNWTLVPKGTVPGRYTALVVYNGVRYIVPDTATAPAGGRSTLSLSTATAWTAVPTMPRGNIAFMFKDRMFIVNKGASSISYSKATDPTNWTPPDGGSFTVSQNDIDGDITDVVICNNLMYIFKMNSTYLFTFDTDPAIDGRVSTISKELGAYSAISYQNTVFIVNRKSVYKVVNNIIVDIAKQLDLPTYASIDALDARNNTFINIEGNRLIIGPFQVGSFYTHFSMNLNTGAWAGRFYDDIYISPGRKGLDAVDSVSFGFGGVSKVYANGLNDGVTEYLCATRLRATFGDGTSTLDLNRSNQAISPEYSLATVEFVGRAFEEWKTLRNITARYNWVAIVSTDNSMDLVVADSGLNNLETKSTPQSNVFYDKLDFTQRRFLGISVKVQKLSKNLGAIDPNANSYLVFRNLSMYWDTVAREINA